jgi:hypothetical protein
MKSGNFIAKPLRRRWRGAPARRDAPRDWQRRSVTPSSGRVGRRTVVITVLTVTGDLARRLRRRTANMPAIGAFINARQGAGRPVSHWPGGAISSCLRNARPNGHGGVRIGPQQKGAMGRRADNQARSVSLCGETAVRSARCGRPGDPGSPVLRVGHLSRMISVPAGPGRRAGRAGVGNHFRPARVCTWSGHLVCPFGEFGA